MPDLWNNAFETSFDGDSIISTVDDKITEALQYIRKVLSVGFTDTSDTEIGSGADVDNIKIKDSCITTAAIADDAVTGDKIAAALVGDGLTQDGDGALQVNVDDSTIEIDTDTVQLKDDGITTAKLNSGFQLPAGTEFDSAVTRYLCISSVAYDTSISSRPFQVGQYYPFWGLPNGAVVTGFRGLGGGLGGDDTIYLMRTPIGNNLETGDSVMASATNENWDTSISNATIDNSSYVYWIKAEYEISGSYLAALIRFTVDRPERCA